MSLAACLFDQCDTRVRDGGGVVFFVICEVKRGGTRNLHGVRNDLTIQANGAAVAEQVDVRIWSKDRPNILGTTIAGNLNVSFVRRRHIEQKVHPVRSEERRVGKE